MNENFQRTLTVDASPEDVLKRISHVNLWWAKDFKGKAEMLGDAFSVHFGDTFVDFQISEFVPNKRVVWKVMDCNLHWIDNKKEWNNTEVVFDVLEMGKLTQVRFTHVGLVPTVECYSDCEVGWNQHVTVSLAKLIQEGAGTPQ